MTTLEKLVVEITADTKGLKSEIANAERLIKGVGDETEHMQTRSDGHLKKVGISWATIGTAAATAAVAIGAAAIAATGKMVQMAADADASTAKFNTIFSGMEGSTQSWVDNFVAATGRHKYATMDALSDIQAVSTAMGVEKEAGVAMAEALLQRSTDVAAFFNAQDPEVLEAIKSGLVGEMEPLKKYGVILSEANVQQELQNMLGVEGAKVATNAQKVQARTNIILAQTAALQGQQAREAGSWQEQLKKLTNDLSTTFADAGRNAMESMTGVITKINEMLGAGGLAAIEGVMGGVANAVAWVAEKVLGAAIAFQSWGQGGAFQAIRTQIEGIVKVFRDWGNNGGFDKINGFINQLKTNWKDAFGGALQTVKDFVGSGGLERMVQAILNSVSAFMKFYNILSDTGVFKRLGAVVETVVRAFLWMIDTGSKISIWLGNLYKSFTNAYDQINTGTQNVKSIISSAWEAIRNIISSVGSSIFSSVVNTWNTIRSSISTAINAISSSVGGGWNGILSTARSIWEQVRSAISGKLDSILSAVQSIVDNIKNVFSGGLGDLVGIAATAMSKAASAISGSGNSLKTAASNAGQMALDGLSSKLSQMQNMYNTIKNINAQVAAFKATSSSSSGSTGSTGIKRQGQAGTGEENVKIREIHDTGGIASYTGWHWLKKNELTVPPQFNWSKSVITPIVKTLQAQQAPARAVQTEAPVKKVIVTINNKSSDVSTLNRVITKAAKVNATARAI